MNTLQTCHTIVIIIIYSYFARDHPTDLWSSYILDVGSTKTSERDHGISRGICSGDILNGTAEIDKPFVKTTKSCLIFSNHSHTPPPPLPRLSPATFNYDSPECCYIMHSIALKSIGDGYEMMLGALFNDIQAISMIILAFQTPTEEQPPPSI